MPLRQRMTVAVAVAVAVAVMAASAVAYLAVRSELLANVDRALEEQPLDLRRGGGPRFGRLPARRGGPTPYIQVIDAGDGVEVVGSEPAALPIEERDIVSRIILDACTPYEWEKRPKEIFMDRAVLERVSKRWNEYGFAGASPVAGMVDRLTRPVAVKKTAQ